MDLTDFPDERDAVIAGVDLVGRTGALEIEFGHLDAVAHHADARWWAKAQYKGKRVTVENHRGPGQAVEALARRLLNGGLCTHCRRTVRLAPADTGAYCVWYREGQEWKRGCE